MADCGTEYGSLPTFKYCFVEKVDEELRNGLEGKLPGLGPTLGDVSNLGVDGQRNRTVIPCIFGRVFCVFLVCGGRGHFANQTAVPQRTYF